MDYIGARVERVIDEVWYPSIVTDLTEENLFSIIYIDDGRKEEGVERNELRPMEKVDQSVEGADGMKPGMSVERVIDGTWFPAVVVGRPPPTPRDEELVKSGLTAENVEGYKGVVNLVYLDDGNFETDVPVDEVRLRAQSCDPESFPSIKLNDVPVSKPGVVSPSRSPRKSNTICEIEEIRRKIDALPGAMKKADWNFERRYSVSAVTELSPLLEVMNEDTIEEEAMSEVQEAYQAAGGEVKTKVPLQHPKDSRKSLPRRSKSVDPTAFLRKQNAFSPDFAPLAGRCAFPECNKFTPYRCARCRAAFFCCRSHQRKQWKDHSPTCYPYLKDKAAVGWASAPSDGHSMGVVTAGTGVASSSRPRDYKDTVDDPGFQTPEKQRQTPQKAVIFADDPYDRGVCSGDKRPNSGLDETHVSDAYDADTDEQYEGQANKRQAGSGGASVPSYSSAAQSAKVGPAPISVASGNTHGPKEEHIAQLAELGFVRDVAVKALTMHANNVERAAEYLFSQAGDGFDSYEMDATYGPNPRPRHWSSSEQLHDGGSARVYPAPDDLRGLTIDTGVQDDDMVTHINEAPTLEDDREMGPIDGTDLRPRVPPQRPSSPTAADDDQIPDLIPPDDSLDGNLIYETSKTLGSQLVLLKVYSQPCTGGYHEREWNDDGLALKIVALPHGSQEEHVLDISQPDIVCICKIHYSHTLLDPSQEIPRASTIVDLIEEIPPIFNAKNRKNQQCQGFQLVSPSTGERIIATSYMRQARGNNEVFTANEIPDDGIELLAGQWRCTYCTFINPEESIRECQACGSFSQLNTPQRMPSIDAQTQSDEAHQEALPGAVCNCEDFNREGRCRHLPTITEARAYGVQEEVLQNQIE